MREVIELPLGVVTGVGPGVGVLDWSTPLVEGELLGVFPSIGLNGFFSVLVTEKRTKLVCEKLVIFPYAQYISRIAI